MYPIIIIAGPTCTGKTALALSVAKKTGSIILPLDQLHLYRYLKEGVGLDLEALSTVDNYGYNILSPWKVCKPKEYVIWLKRSIKKFVEKQSIIIEGGCTSYLKEIINKRKLDPLFSLIKIVALDATTNISQNSKYIAGLYSINKIKKIINETRTLEELGFIKASGLSFFRKCERLFIHPEHDDPRLAWALRISARMYLPSYLALKGKIFLENAQKWTILNVHEIQNFQKERVHCLLPSSDVRSAKNYCKIEQELVDYINNYICE